MIFTALGCGTELSESPLIERSVAPDMHTLPPSFDEHGGPVRVQLTGWANPEAITLLVAAGLQPLPGYARVERLDTLGLNVVGGTVPPGGLDRIAAVRFVVRIEPLR